MFSVIQFLGFGSTLNSPITFIQGSLDSLSKLLKDHVPINRSRPKYVPREVVASIALKQQFINSVKGKCDDSIFVNGCEA